MKCQGLQGPLAGVGGARFGGVLERAWAGAALAGCFWKCFGGGRVPWGGAWGCLRDAEGVPCLGGCLGGGSSALGRAPGFLSLVA